jgi:hypothetical protein
MKFTFILLVIAQTCTALKCLVMNDVHLNITYVNGISMPGEETSMELITLMINEMKSEEAKSNIAIDAILIPGDFVVHNLASNSVLLGDPNWPL